MRTIRLVRLGALLVMALVSALLPAERTAPPAPHVCALDARPAAGGADAALQQKPAPRRR